MSFGVQRFQHTPETKVSVNCHARVVLATVSLCICFFQFIKNHSYWAGSASGVSCGPVCRVFKTLLSAHASTRKQGLITEHRVNGTLESPLFFTPIRIKLTFKLLLHLEMMKYPDTALPHILFVTWLCELLRLHAGHGTLPARADPPPHPVSV